MNSKRIMHLVFVLSLILVSGFAAAPASANGPIIVEEPYDDSGLVVDSEDECGFPIEYHSFGTLKSKVWLDEYDVMYQAHQNWDLTEVWTSEGNTLEFKYNYPGRGWFETYSQGYAIYLGAEMFTLPHEGVVYAFSGYISYYLFRENGNLQFGDVIKQAGNFQVDWPAICEYMAP